MEEKKFRSVSVRDSLLRTIEKFINENPEFVERNPAFNTVAGFINEATRLKLLELEA